MLRARLDHALELYQLGLAPRILTTRRAGGDPVFTEGGVSRSYLMSHGVPSDAIIVETEGESTVYSVALSAEIIRRMGLRSAIVVSDGYHVYRVKKMLEASKTTEDLAATHLLGLIQPVHIANMAVYLASDEAERTTGQIIPVDSGATIR